MTQEAKIFENKTLPGVKHIILVASGKGGVGKSSVCLNLAYALQSLTLNIAVLDADIFGPSIANLIDHHNKPEALPNKKILPVIKEGIKFMSMGFIASQDKAIIWRGLMVQHAINQMLFDVIWGFDGKAVDVLLIDMPPGTGDVQLSILQKLKIDGALVVTIAHELSIIDVARTIDMFKKTNIDIIGIVKNMSHFSCAHCKMQSNIFSSKKIDKILKEKNISLLADIPLDEEFAIAAEDKRNFILTHKDCDITKEFLKIATLINNNILK